MDQGSVPNGLAPVSSVSPPREWSWPPESPWHPGEGARYLTEEWAPPTSVRYPWVRLGRWTLLYRRQAA